MEWLTYTYAGGRRVLHTALVAGRLRGEIWPDYVEDGTIRCYVWRVRDTWWTLERHLVGCRLRSRRSSGLRICSMTEPMSGSATPDLTE